MGILGFGKKKEATKSGCCCAGACDTESTTKVAPVEKVSDCCSGGNCGTRTMEAEKQEHIEGRSVKVLGSGCTKCNQLEVATREALDQLGIDITIEHVTDFAEIAAYGVMTTPALVVDEKVVSFGKVLKTEEVVKILQAII